MSIYEEYARLHEDHVQAYGSMGLCLMQVGSFYEVYSYEKEWISDLSEALDIRLTRKNKSLPVGPSNPYMLGVPVHVIGNYISKLMNKGYSIALISQETDESNKNGRKIRQISDIITPSTYVPIEENVEDIARNIMVMYVKRSIEYKSKKVYHIVSSVVCDPVTSKRVRVCENMNYEIDDNLMHDDVVRMLLEYDPIELFIITDDGVEVFKSCYSSCTRAKPIFQKLSKCMNDRMYRSKMIEKAYPESKSSELSPVEFIGLERTVTGEIALCCMLEKLYEFSNSCIRSLKIPELMDRTSMLLLENNAKDQLDIPILIQLLNNCKTPMGRRLFIERLVHPSSSEADIKNRFEELQESVMGLGLEDISKSRGALDGIKDMNKFITQIERKRASPRDVWNLFQSVKKGANAMRIDDPLKSSMHGIYRENVLEGCISIDMLIESVFEKGVYPDLDRAIEEHDISDKYFSDLANYLNVIFCEGKKQSYFHVEHVNRDGPTIVITKKRWEEVAKATKEGSIFFESIRDHIKGRYRRGDGDGGDHMDMDMDMDYSIRSLTVVNKGSTGTSVRLSHCLLDIVSDMYLESRDRFKPLHKECFLDSLSRFQIHFREIEKLSDCIAKRDLLLTCGKNAMELKYCIPSVCGEGEGEGDRLIFGGLRHPLIEGKVRENICVPNDIRFGNVSGDGVLLYGMNSAGKSSLMKAIGLSVIMAQAGMPVPAQFMRFRPFTRLFTRIEKGDNIMSGKSTFIAEMGEFRNIHRLADKDSLIIGDELCSGTEHDSAVAIVASGVVDLSARGSTFVFATHLHKLVDLEWISTLSNVHAMHLNTELDPMTGRLTYDRKLRKGCGPTSYGLEVCRSLDMNTSFLRRAEAVRKHLMGEQSKFVSKRKSRYNKKKILDICEKCGKNMAEESHHIIHQKDAKEMKIPNIHNLQNLEALCKQCHLLEHTTH